MKTVLGWHFTDGDTLANGDGRRIVVGETLGVEGEVNLCSHGLHASKNILDALKYAPGNMLWRVELSGNVLIGDDKMVGSRRKALWRLDAGDVLSAFARRCALDVIHLWDAPDVVVEYLKTGDQASQDAAQDAAWAAVQDAAWAAAWAAAQDAAWAAAQAAVRAAVRAAAWDATRDAAWDKKARRLVSMARAAHKKDDA